VPFGNLLEAGLLQPGQTLWFAKDQSVTATVQADGKIVSGALMGSIHSVAKSLLNGAPVNGWDVWLCQKEKCEMILIDELRKKIKMSLKLNSNP
jgi:modification methylase